LAQSCVHGREDLLDQLAGALGEEGPVAVTHQSALRLGIMARHKA
jgi:hypothetical protein